MILFAVIGVCVSWILTSIFNGWVLKTLWAWFMVTTFEIPALSIPAAIGMALVVRFLTWQPTKTDASKKPLANFAEEYIKGVLTCFTVGLLSLFVGWIAKGYM